jgi:biotin transport system substrate-specific component
MSQYMSVVDTYFLKSEKKSLMTEALLVFSGSIFIALSAYVYIPLSFTPVPITLQTYSVLTLASLMGSKRAPLSVVVYLMLGALGFPVLSEGRAGLEVMFGATGGYLLGFIFSSYMVGLLIEKGWDRSFLKALFTFCIGQLLIFVPGLLWLGQFTGYETVLEKGFYPFIIGGIVKAALCVTTSLSIWKILGQKKGLQNGQ